ncbi:MAG: cystathionine beta-lyase [Rhizobiales bacterium 62-17]|mgnify:CR=1 FL=1|nr:cystathionine beta-lyase [Hyphomicrobiales bacterium]OJY04480.1 MAG: cystathionine beta-lyase [Rhizobiales bacterium 62-17]
MSKISKETKARLKARTKLVYAGRQPEEQFGFVNTPIYRGSTVLSPTVEHLVDPKKRFSYGTKGNPTTEALENAWSELSGAHGTVLAPSGLGAIALAFSAVTKSGDHILVTDSAYRPTRNFCERYLRRMGVETTYFDPYIGSGIADLIRPNTTAILTEAPGSQSFEMQDIPAISAIAKKRGICVIMDNTWATPLFFPPHERGVDLAIEAGTKYLAGHSDLLLGLVSSNAEYWPRLRETFDLFANCAGPEDAFLALRGMRTMELRLKEAERQGLAMAHWLAARPEVKEVLHPALPSHRGHDIWKRDFLGSSGLFSVILHPHSDAAVAAMLDGLELFGMGYSWGGFESLVIPFDCSPYRSATPWNPGGPALRFQIGLEDVSDLQADLDAGFSRLRKAS